MTVYQLLWKNLLIYLVLFIVLISIGSVGFFIIEDYQPIDAVYMTVITLSTVGFGLVKELSFEGKSFTIILILSNLIIFTYTLTRISKFFFDPDIRYNYKKIKMEEAVKKLDNHVIICGFGRNGSKAYEDLQKNNIPIVIIDNDFDETTEHLDYLIRGDATQDEILIKAGIKKAKFIISALPNDAENVFVVLSAKELNPKIKAISRASNESSVAKLKLAGASNVIMPDKLGGAHMATLVMYPDVKEFIDTLSTDKNITVSELNITKQTTIGNLDAWSKTGATILGLKQEDGNFLINPDKTVTINENQFLIVLGSVKQINLLKEMI
ncbi:MAG: NAD-binding protein [Chitinophagales bacterium]|nr:NAD-binding protein [Chitinophagales bacterium]